MTTNCTVDIYAKLLKYLCIFFSRNVQILVLYAFHHQVLAAVMLPQIFILIKIENLISADGHILRCPGSNITENTLELKTKVRKGPYFYLGLLILEIRRGENLRSQNRPSKTRRGAADLGLSRVLFPINIMSS